MRGQANQELWYSDLKLDGREREEGDKEQNGERRSVGGQPLALSKGFSQTTEITQYG